MYPCICILYLSNASNRGICCLRNAYVSVAPPPQTPVWTGARVPRPARPPLPFSGPGLLRGSARSGALQREDVPAAGSALAGPHALFFFWSACCGVVLLPSAAPGAGGAWSRGRVVRQAGGPGAVVVVVVRAGVYVCVEQGCQGGVIGCLLTASANTRHDTTHRSTSQHVCRVQAGVPPRRSRQGAEAGQGQTGTRSRRSRQGQTDRWSTAGGSSRQQWSREQGAGSRDQTAESNG